MGVTASANCCCWAPWPSLFFIRCESSAFSACSFRLCMTIVGTCDCEAFVSGWFPLDFWPSSTFPTLAVAVKIRKLFADLKETWLRNINEYSTFLSLSYHSHRHYLAVLQRNSDCAFANSTCVRHKASIQEGKHNHQKLNVLFF